jgi:hypothetical protein
MEEGGHQMSTSTLEERVALLEQEVLTLKQQLPQPAPVPWWEQISGAFADVSAFAEAAELGRRYRAAQRPVADEGEDVPAGH